MFSSLLFPFVLTHLLSLLLALLKIVEPHWELDRMEYGVVQLGEPQDTVEGEGKSIIWSMLKQVSVYVCVCVCVCV